MIEISRSITKKLHRSLLPYEDDICKLEDLVFFLNPKSSIFFFISINIPFFIIYFVDLSFYSILFIFMGLYFASSFINVRKLYSIFLEKKITDIEPEKNFKRFNIAQISALIGTSIFAILYFFERAFNAIIQHDLKIIIETLFVLAFLLYFFFTTSDFFLCCFSLNLILLLPLLLQKKIIYLIDLYRDKIFYMIFKMKSENGKSNSPIENQIKGKKLDNEDSKKENEAKNNEGFIQSNKDNSDNSKNEDFKQENEVNDKDFKQENEANDKDFKQENENIDEDEKNWLNSP